MSSKDEPEALKIEKRFRKRDQMIKPSQYDVEPGTFLSW